MTTTDGPAIGSLFSGVGGLDLGVQAALGGHLAWHAETNPRAVQVLARHWPHTPNHGDVTTLDWHTVSPVHILTAGIPCQDLSVAGPRTGLTPGTRSGLWTHVPYAIAALNPHLVVIENVRGLLSTRAGTHPRPTALRHLEPCPRCMGDPANPPGMRALGVLLADLADLGYDASWTCVRAADVGAPHRRDRVFLLAWPAPQNPDREPRHQRRLPAPHQTQGRRPRPHPGRRDRAPAPHPESQRRSERLTQPALPQRQPDPDLHSGPPPCRTTAHGSREGRQTPPHPDLGGRPRRCRYHPETPGRHEPPHSHRSPAEWWGTYLPAIRRWEAVTGHPAPTPTVPGTRRLSAHLVEWMMGLPTGWITHTPGLSRAAQLHLLGNSVVPQQAAHALNLLLSEGTLLGSPSSRCRFSAARSGR
ncbi:DNA (cytosine-5-)-methyltransferase [Streptomyces sp. NBC_00237]|uniref:DNA cytosine methyltransferase n=1 Tax=Streptomyces sp. NBC_00237 TaxID=2975687 RepID=UPI0022513684|nr:DNA (cytosine-5-)-methyltransferase [Streptomyces sp. NBC_00237]MCX5206924.1 DNA (cytosine-5-)-methyltransferase [Streptomyces sp. NBC_00237]